MATACTPVYYERGFSEFGINGCTVGKFQTIRVDRWGHVIGIYCTGWAIPNTIERRHEWYIDADTTLIDPDEFYQIDFHRSLREATEPEPEVLLVTHREEGNVRRQSQRL